MNDTNGLSREQVAALRVTLHRVRDQSDHSPNPEWQTCFYCEQLAGDLAPTVAAMLADTVRQRDNAQRLTTHYQRETKALRRRIDAALESPGGAIDKVLAVRAALDMPSAVREGGTERAGACGQSAAKGATERVIDCPLPVGHGGLHLARGVTGHLPADDDRPDYRSAAAGAPPEPREAFGGTDVQPESSRPSGGRTGPYTFITECETCGWQVETTSGAELAHMVTDHKARHAVDPTCGEALGDMRCQLRRGHDGGHEDWRDVADEAYFLPRRPEAGL